jgi:PqqD family protein of HPr-rel-A system
MSNRLRDLAISESGFVFDPQSGAMYTLNATGIAVVEALREGAGKAELRERLRERFDEAPTHLDDDVADFLHTLTQLGLLPGSAS